MAQKTPDPSRGLTRAAVSTGRCGQRGRRLLAETVRDVHASEAALWLISEDGLALEGALNDGPSRKVLEAISVPVADSVIGMVAATGIATSIGPDDYHNPAVDERTGVKTVAMIATPVHVDNRLCGVLSAINPQDKPLFGAEDLEALEWKAYLLGLILGDLH